MEIINPITSYMIDKVLSLFKQEVRDTELDFFNKGDLPSSYNSNLEISRTLMSNCFNIKKFKDLERYNNLIVIPTRTNWFRTFFKSHFLVPKYIDNKVIPMSYYRLIRNLIESHKSFEIDYLSGNISKEIFFKYDFDLRNMYLPILLSEPYFTRNNLYEYVYIFKYPKITNDEKVVVFPTQFIFVISNDLVCSKINSNFLTNNLFALKLCHNFGLYDYIKDEFESEYNVKESDICSIVHLRNNKESYLDYYNLNEYYLKDKNNEL